MIRLGGLTWTLAVGAEFWQHEARAGVQFAHLSQRAIGDYCVDRLGGAIERPTAGNVGRCRWQAANDADAG